MRPRDVLLIVVILFSTVASHMKPSGAREALSIMALGIMLGFLFGFIRAAINDLKSHK
jgi:hypothetical protein